MIVRSNLVKNTMANHGLFFYVFSTLSSKYFHYKFCRWLDLNCGSLVLEATALPTEPQPLLPPINKFQVVYDCLLVYNDTMAKFHCSQFFRPHFDAFSGQVLVASRGVH